MQPDEILANLLGCGTLDWKCIEDCGFDLRELAERYIKDTGEMPNMENLLNEIFIEGIEMMKEMVEIKKQKVSYTTYIIPDKKEEILKELDKLDPENDFDYDTNYLAASISIIQNKEIYEEYFSEELKEIENEMGYDIIR